MNSVPHRFSLSRVFAAACLIAATSAAGMVGLHAADHPALLDDFSDAEKNRHGVPRFVVTDKDLGSQSQATQACANGLLTVTGELVPGRGVPAFISIPLMLSPEGKPQDLSGYTGVRLRVLVRKGSLSVQVASSEITNFDYHSSAPIAGKDGEMQEVRIAFKDLKRGWSEQIALNRATITSVNLVAFGLAKAAFAYEVDEIGFY